MIYFKSQFRKITLFTATILGITILLSCGEKDTGNLKNPNNSTFYIDSANAQFTVVDGANAQGLPNKKLLGLTVCLKDNAQTNSVNNLTFKIKAGDVETSKVADRKGCLFWQELVDYNPLEAEKNIFMVRKIEATENHSGIEKFVFSINPWKDDFKPNLQGSYSNTIENDPINYKVNNLKIQSLSSSYDYDFYVKLNDTKLVNGKSTNISNNEIYAGSLKLTFQTIFYDGIELDSNLNISIPYRYQTDLELDILRQNITQIANEKILKGKFLFNLVFLKEFADIDDPKTEDILSSLEFVGSLEGPKGKVKALITPKFKDLASLSSHVYILLTISPLDDSLQLGEQSFKGIINSLASIQSDVDIGLSLASSNAKNLHKKFIERGDLFKAEKLSYDVVLKEKGYLPLKSTQVKFETKEWFFKTMIHYVDVNQILNSQNDRIELTKEEKQGLCVALFEDKLSILNKLYKECLDSPEDFLSVGIKDFVNALRTNPTEVVPLAQEKIEVNTSFTIDSSDKRETSYGYGANGEIELEGSLGGRLGGSSNVVDSVLGKADCKTEKIEIKDKKGKVFDTKDKNFCKGNKAQIGINLNFGINGKGYFANTYEIAEDSNKSLSIVSSDNILTTPFSIVFEARVTRCLLINSKNKTNETKEQYPSSKYICTKQFNTVKTESYFLLDQKRFTDSNALVDINSSVASPLRMLIRGVDSYNYIKSIISSRDVFLNIVLFKWNNDGSFSDASKFMSQQVPLMLSSGKTIIMNSSEKSSANQEGLFSRFVK